jgi:hypothetical protein
LSGRIIVNDEMNATMNFAEYITDVSQFNKGSYLIKVYTSNGVSLAKFIKP